VIGQMDIELGNNPQPLSTIGVSKPSWICLSFIKAQSKRSLMHHIRSKEDSKVFSSLVIEGSHV